jgi:hypothetical protein
MPKHSGGVFENFIRKSPLLIESKNNIVPKPDFGKELNTDINKIK